MKNERTNTKLLAAGTITALGASLCCITPLLALVAGIGGVSSAFSRLDPFRPFFTGLTLLVLGFAWFQQLKPKKEAMVCDCEDEKKESFGQSKAFLGIVTALALLLLSFPYYSSAFFPESPKKAVSAIAQPAQQQEAQLQIKGMTCAGCEQSVNHVLKSQEGVVEAKASYETGMAQLSYDPSITSPESLKAAIEEELGYQVTNIETGSDKKD